MLRPGATLAGVVVMVYGVANIVKAQDPDSSAWAAGHAGAWALIASGGLATFGYFLVAFGYNRRLKTEESEAALYKTCRSLARVVAQGTGIDQDRVGVHVWAVAGPPGLTHLVRRVKYLSVDVERPESGITWRRGRGALGICWIEREQKVWDLEDLQRRARTKRDFCEALSPYERMGLRWSDFQNTKHFTAAWVQPIFKPGEETASPVASRSTSSESPAPPRDWRRWCTRRASTCSASDRSSKTSFDSRSIR